MLRIMTRKLRRFAAACTLAALAVACSGSSSDVRETAFPADGAASAVGSDSTGFDTTLAWSCGDADVQAVFAPSFTGDALVAAVKTAIADPAKADASFSFVKPIRSFTTEFDARALCLTIEASADTAATQALVRQLRSSGNVISVRRR